MICGVKVPIKIKKQDPNVLAQYLDRERVIEVDPETLKIDILPEVIFHEMVHACLAITGITELIPLEMEEAVCRAMENLCNAIPYRKK